MSTRRFGDGSRASKAVADLDTLLGPDTLSRLRNGLELGALVGLSLSRDGGALSCALTVDGVTERDWFRHAGELLVWLDDMLGLIESGEVAEPLPATREGAVRGRQNGRRRAGSG